MFKKYYPYARADDVFGIDYEKLYAMGYRGLMFDIDNTLVPHGADSTEEVDALFRRIGEIGFAAVIVSDNSAERIERFLKNIDAPYVSEAGKPDPSGFLRALGMIGTKKSETLMIGDQIFRDILGANNAGIPSVLVRYVGYGTTRKIGIRRRLEKIILKFYSAGGAKDRLGDVSKKEERE